MVPLSFLFLLSARPPQVHFMPKKALVYNTTWKNTRPSTAKKVKFSDRETEDLVDGIARYGYGNWAKILASYKFHSSRNKVSLKDKARNLRGREQ